MSLSFILATVGEEYSRHKAFIVAIGINQKLYIIGHILAEFTYIFACISVNLLLQKIAVNLI
jgi:hypothetical protein